MKKLTVLLSALTIIAGLFFANSAFAAKPGDGVSTAWKMVYENDKDGNAISGSLTDLISAIKKGADVKVVTASQGETPDTWTRAWSRVCNLVIAYDNNGTQKAFCYFHGNSMTGFDLTNPDNINLKDFWHTHHILKTTGVSERLFYDISNGVTIPLERPHLLDNDPAVPRVHMQWYIK